MERIARPGTRLFLISDFHDLLVADHLGPLRRLARKTQVVAISVADRLEAALPEAGFYTVTDGLNRAQLDTSFSEARETYVKDFQQQQEQLSRQLRELRIPLLPILTEQDPLKQLLTVFPAR